MILICTNTNRDFNLEITNDIKEKLELSKFKVKVLKVFQDEIIIDEIPSLIIIIGGDGTILSVVKDVFKYEIPIMGINLGTKGFMTSIEKDQTDLVLEAANGKYFCSNRMMLDVFVNNKFYSSALNDAVIHGYGECINLDAKSNDIRIASFTGDGIIIATPTGSTGYSLSAGGPIVEPEAENIIVSPICAHSMGIRSFVFDKSRNISVKITLPYDRSAYLSIDGNSQIDLYDGDCIKIIKSDYYVKMINMKQKTFFENTFDKLI